MTSVPVGGCLLCEGGLVTEDWAAMHKFVAMEDRAGRTGRLRRAGEATWYFELME